ncbi:MAG: FAD:protein FMN transferase [Anaerovoracaceae bacterium]
MLRKSLPMLLVMLMMFTFISCDRQKVARYEGEFLQLFDTATRIIGYTESRDAFEEYVQQFHDELEKYHQLYDIYNDYPNLNNIKTINDNAGIKPVKVDGKIIDLLDFGKEIYEVSEGQVNIALGAVLKIWHEYRETAINNPEKAKVPPMEILMSAAEHIDIEDVIIDRKNSTVFLRDPEMSIDVGGLAKGYATEQAGLFIQQKGLKDCLISVGGNVRSFGYKGDGRQLWNIGIQNPDMGEDDLYTLQITNKSLVTSGDYIRYYTVDGKRYHHIIDPTTLMPSDYFRAVTIVCEDSGMADALSTMLYNMPYEKGLKYIESLEDAQAVWIFPDGTKKYSQGFEEMLMQ